MPPKGQKKTRKAATKKDPKKDATVAKKGPAKSAPVAKSASVAKKGPASDPVKTRLQKRKDHPTPQPSDDEETEDPLKLALADPVEEAKLAAEAKPAAAPTAKGKGNAAKGNGKPPAKGKGKPKMDPAERQLDLNSRKKHKRLAGVKEAKYLVILPIGKRAVPFKVPSILSIARKNNEGQVGEGSPGPEIREREEILAFLGDSAWHKYDFIELHSPGNLGGGEPALANVYGSTNFSMDGISEIAYADLVEHMGLDPLFPICENPNVAQEDLVMLEEIELPSSLHAVAMEMMRLIDEIQLEREVAIPLEPPRIAFVKESNWMEMYRLHPDRLMKLMNDNFDAVIDGHSWFLHSAHPGDGYPLAPIQEFIKSLQIVHCKVYPPPSCSAFYMDKMRLSRALVELSPPAVETRFSDLKDFETVTWDTVLDTFQKRLHAVCPRRLLLEGIQMHEEEAHGIALKPWDGAGGNGFVRVYKDDGANAMAVDIRGHEITGSPSNWWNALGTRHEYYIVQPYHDRFRVQQNEIRYFIQCTENGAFEKKCMVSTNVNNHGKLIVNKKVSEKDKPEDKEDRKSEQTKAGAEGHSHRDNQLFFLHIRGFPKALVASMENHASSNDHLFFQHIVYRVDCVRDKIRGQTQHAVNEMTPHPIAEDYLTDLCEDQHEVIMHAETIRNFFTTHWTNCPPVGPE